MMRTLFVLPSLKTNKLYKNNITLIFLNNCEVNTCFHRSRMHVQHKFLLLMNDYAKLYQQLVLWRRSVRDLYLRYVSR